MFLLFIPTFASLEHRNNNSFIVFMHILQCIRQCLSSPILAITSVHYYVMFKLLYSQFLVSYINRTSALANLHPILLKVGISQYINIARFLVVHTVLSCVVFISDSIYLSSTANAAQDIRLSTQSSYLVSHYGHNRQRPDNSGDGQKISH